MKVNEEYSWRYYQIGDEKLIVEHLKSSFGIWPNFDLVCSAEEHWSWKFLENVHKSFICTLAINSGKVIGSQHRLPVNIKIKDNICKGISGVDFSVHPDFRRRGISKKLTELTENHDDYAKFKIELAISMNPILIKKRTMEGKNFPYEVKRIIKIRDVNLHIKKKPIENAWIKKTGYSILNLINSFKLKNQSCETDCSYLLHQTRIFDVRIEYFWERLKKHYDFIVERSPTYLNWRYCYPRGGNYRVTVVEENKSILGYSILRINNIIDDYPEGFVVDLISLPDKPGVADLLVSDALSYFDENNVNVVRAMCLKDQPFYRKFKEYGFMDIPDEIGLFYNGNKLVKDGINKTKENNASNLHFVYGDTDWI
ncbi:hypothetical protein MCGE09_00063 [Thaumarchaeota archaeon SCGC AB-539-E09]|nr:hypothetical protein MCGE09_00063 [Thaumarchaeota archaeon SCGC AB-539-E09]